MSKETKKKRFSDAFEERLIKNEKYMIPTLLCLTLMLVIINLLWGSDDIVMAARDNYELEAQAGEETSITIEERVVCTAERIKTVSYNAGYWKVRVLYLNLFEMCADKGIVREKLYRVMSKFTGDESYKDTMLYQPTRISPYEIGFVWGEQEFEEY